MESNSETYDFKIPLEGKITEKCDCEQFEIPANDEVIEDLTKDLEKQNILENEKSDEFEETSEKNDEKVKNPLNDFIDEDKLKIEQESLSEEEKQSRQAEAEKLKQEGNGKFKNALYLDSIDFYTNALRLCPPVYEKDRSILYSNRAASKIKLEYNKTALDDLNIALELNPIYTKALLRRAKLYNAMDKLDESLEDYKKLHEMDRSNGEVYHEIRDLTSRIEKRNEEMKEEMMGKLKDLGNMFLKPFGLSTNNFQLNKDPNSGGYSVNFTQSGK